MLQVLRDGAAGSCGSCRDPWLVSCSEYPVVSLVVVVRRPPVFPAPHVCRTFAACFLLANLYLVYVYLVLELARASN